MEVCEVSWVLSESAERLDVISFLELVLPMSRERTETMSEMTGKGSVWMGDLVCTGECERAGVRVLGAGTGSLLVSRASLALSIRDSRGLLWAHFLSPKPLKMGNQASLKANKSLN